MKFLAIILTLFVALSALPLAEAALVVNKYTNDFTLSSPNNEQLKVCSCGLKTDLLIIENVGNFEANYRIEIISPVENWMTLGETEFTIPPKHRKEVLNYVETPCGEVGTYDYRVKVTSSYGREEVLYRTIRADTCQNVDLTVKPLEVTSNLCQPVLYDVDVKNVGTYGETYELGFGSYDQYMEIGLREFYLKPGENYRQDATLTLPCEFYGEYEIPFIAFSSKNKIEDTETAILNVENQFNHSINLPTEQQLCSRVTETIPFSITNEIDVANEYSINIHGPKFVDVKDNQRTVALDGEESVTLMLESRPEEGQEGEYLLEVEVTDKYGKVEKTREMTLDVKNCYDFAIEVRDENQNQIDSDNRCCGLETYYLNIRNTGQTVETYNIESVGPSWFRPEELSVNLNPGESKNVRIFADAPCANEVYEIPVVVTNDRFDEVREEVLFTINSQTERMCHFVAIDDDEFVITKDATFTPVIVKHNGTEGGIYDVRLESEMYTLVEDQIEIYPGETRILHLETNTSDLEFGRYISQPIFTYSEANNPLASLTRDLDYVEHIGVELEDQSIFTKLWNWIKSHWWLPGLCGWIGIILLIILLVLLVLYLLGVRIPMTEVGANIWRLALLIAMLLVLVLFAFIKLPGADVLYELPDNESDYFITIYQNGRESVDLDDYFVDPDSDLLAYTATQPADIAVKIEGTLMTLTPDYGFTGTQQLVVTAEDGNGGYEDSPVLDVHVIPRKDLGFLGWWHTYCVQINLLLLFLILLLLIFFPKIKAEKEEKPAKQIFIVTPKKTGYVAAKKQTPKNTVVKKSVVKKAAVKKKSAKKKMSAAQRAKISKALDRALVSSEEHEMRQVLDTHGKRGTQANVAILQKALRDFKADKAWKPKNREKFYSYIKAKNILSRLENKPAPKKTVKKTAVKKTAARKGTRTAAQIDRNRVSQEPHELKQVLATHGKRGTKRNIELLGKYLAEFKKSRYKPKNRATFYRFLKEQDKLRTLHNK